MSNIINYINTYQQLLTEDELVTNLDLNSRLTLGQVDNTKDEASLINKFNTRPLGIIITDSYNNPFFPIRPRPRIDTSKMDLFEIFRRYRELYEQYNSWLLPWHYCIELIDSKYFIFNTRPLDMKFIINSTTAVNRQDLWDETTKRFMLEKPFDIEQSLHVLIIGDSNLDVYTKKFYEMLGRTCIVPFIRYFKLPYQLGQRVWSLNTGRKFDPTYMMRFVRK